MTREPSLRARTYCVLAACIILGGLAPRLDSLHLGFTVDDYAQLAMLGGRYPVARSPLQLFTFSDGSAAENRALQRTGFFPWWSHPELRISMCRPLSSALLWLDWSLFGLSPLGYHLHTLAWWLALLALLALLLRRVLPDWAALLALALFVADDGHSMLLGWIAMRNAIVATVFGLLGLWFQQRAPAGAGARARLPALLAFALALCASEYALALIGYALLIELLARPSARSRVAAAAPWAALLLAYFGLRAALGFGSYGSGMYVDPIAETDEFLRQAAVRLPVLAGDVVLSLPANFWTAGWPWVPELAARGVLPAAWAQDMLPLRRLQQWTGVLALAIFALIVRRAARAPALVRARPLMLGAPLALLPVLPALPEGRLLAPALVGWSVALAGLVYVQITGFRAAPGARAALGCAAALALAALQLTLPPWLGFIQSRLGRELARGVSASILTPKLDAPLRAGKRVLLLAAADPTTTIYIPLVRRVHGRPAPEAVQLLAGTFAPHRVFRLSPNAFVLERLHAGMTAGDAYASAFNSQPLHSGESFQVEGMRVIVERVRRGRPLRTRYELDRPLEEPEVVLLLQTASGLVRSRFPRVGESKLLPAPWPPIAR